MARKNILPLKNSFPTSKMVAGEARNALKNVFKKGADPAGAPSGPPAPPRVAPERPPAAPIHRGRMWHSAAVAVTCEGGLLVPRSFPFNN